MKSHKLIEIQVNITNAPPFYFSVDDIVSIDNNADTKIKIFYEGGAIIELPVVSHTDETLRNELYRLIKLARSDYHSAGKKNQVVYPVPSTLVDSSDPAVNVSKLTDEATFFNPSIAISEV